MGREKSEGERRVRETPGFGSLYEGRESLSGSLCVAIF